MEGVNGSWEESGSHRILLSLFTQDIFIKRNQEFHFFFFLLHVSPSAPPKNPNKQQKNTQIPRGSDSSIRQKCSDMFETRKNAAEALVGLSPRGGGVMNVILDGGGQGKGKEPL